MKAPKLRALAKRHYRPTPVEQLVQAVIEVGYALVAEGKGELEIRMPLAPGVTGVKVVLVKEPPPEG